MSSQGNIRERFWCAQARATHRTGSALGLALLFAVFSMARAEAHDESPDYSSLRVFSRPGCYQLVQDAGRMIAWARWEHRLARADLQAMKLEEDTPTWIVTLVHQWIADAYEWRATDEQVYQWAAELGNTERLPRATQLSKHETIAIWMRRIARQCDGPSPYAAAEPGSANQF